MSNSSPPNDGPYTENTAMRDILAWSGTRADWQKDALRRIVLNGSLSNNDLLELEAICIGDKKEGAVLDNRERLSLWTCEKEFEPLNENHLRKGAVSVDV